MIEGLKNHRHLKIPVDQIMVSFSQCIRSNATVPVTFSVTMILKNSQKRTENGVSLPNGPHKETKKCLDQKVPVFFVQNNCEYRGYTPSPLCTTAPGVTSGILQVVIVSVINYPTVNLDFNKPANYVNIHYRSKLEGGQVSSVVEQMFKPV